MSIERAKKKDYASKVFSSEWLFTSSPVFPLWSDMFKSGSSSQDESDGCIGLKMK